MREILPTLRLWADDGRPFALATIVRTRGSAPRQTGSVMGVRDDGLVCGSVSGGCIDSAVIEAALTALQTGEAKRIGFPQVSEDKAWEVGLMCGGEVDVWIDPSPVARDPSMWAELVSFLEGDVACVLATRFEPFAQTVRRPGDAVCCSPLDTAVSEAHRERQSALRDVAGEEWFFNVLAPRPRLVIVGAVHIAKALVAMANAVGFETIVIEPRTALTKSERFDVQPDAMIEQWPQDAFKEIALNEDTYAVALTHDPKIDDNALEVLLKSNVAYVGALGSKTTQDKRRKSLSETGLTDEQLDRIHGPVGLEIGAKTPEEIALSIIAQIVKVRRARS